MRTVILHVSFMRLVCPGMFNFTLLLFSELTKRKYLRTGGITVFLIFPNFPDFGKKLTYDEWKPLYLRSLSDGGDIFGEIEKKDILLHFPYHSYNPILSFFNQAAIDPGVNEIYITLYRVAADSLIANALISAARNGKKVTVFIELKARFDEANNIIWSKKMKKAGVQIIYSIPGIKVHTKIALCNPV